MRVPYDQMEFVYIDNHYDVHLSGLCKHNGELARFETHDTTDYQKMNDDCPYCSEKTCDPLSCQCVAYVDLECEIIPLTPAEKIKFLLNKKAFEVCVGTHWSYDNGKRGGYFKGWTPLARFYFWASRKLKQKNGFAEEKNT